MSNYGKGHGSDTIERHRSDVTKTRHSEQQLLREPVQVRMGADWSPVGAKQWVAKNAGYHS
jgi:hypothetical protein